AVNSRQVLRIAGTNGRDPGGQPRRQSAIRPFRADVRAGPQEDIEADVARETDERLEVLPAVETDVAFDALVEVPRHVGIDSGCAHSGQTTQAVCPLSWVHPEVVQCAGEDAVRSTITDKLAALPIKRRLAP